MSEKHLAVLVGHLAHNVLVLALFGIAVKAGADKPAAAALVLLVVVLDGVITVSSLGDA